MEDTRSKSNTIWRILLFDGPILTDASGNEVRRFRSQRVGALLAYLSLHINRPCPREEICDALWPEENLEVSANRLRVTLTSLRRQMEPSGVLFGTVIDVSTPGCIRLNSETVWCDTATLERALATGRREEAARLVRGTLLPGYYDEWAIEARQRYEALCDSLVGMAHATEQAASIPAAASPAVADGYEPPRQAVYRRLPLYLTRFFGRETERQHLRDLVAANRLVTLTGAGGIGKTRLAVEAAKEIPRACIFVPLADLPDPTRVPEATLQALLISPQVDIDPVEQLITVLQHHEPVLLILDNAEHVLHAVLSLSLRLLEAAPDLHLLVTSRHRLDIPGELVLPLAPLEPPPYASAPERLEEFPAIALFLDRARNVLPDFTVTSRHVDTLVEICRRLEGMPLALELAAARVTSQTPAQIASTLAANLMDLKSRQRGLSERHRSLRAAIQGSYDLLPPDLQRFFAMLSVFQGGWTVEAAQAILDSIQNSASQNPAIQNHASEFLEELTIRSLVVAREDQILGKMRYSWLEALRQFAAEQLDGIDLPVLTKSHTDYFLTLAARVDQDDIRTIDPIDAEQENILTALERGREEPNELFWNGLAGWLVHAFVRGHHRVCIDWAELAMSGLNTIPYLALRTRVRFAVTLILHNIGRFEAVRRVAMDQQRESEAICDPIGQVHAITLLGFLADNFGEFETAVQIQRDALQRIRSMDSKPLLLSSLSLTAGALISFGSGLEIGTEAGSSALQEAEILAREMLARISPYSRRLPLALFLLAQALFYQGKTDEAYAFLKKSQRAALELRVPLSLMIAFLYECQTAITRGYYDHAALRYGASLTLQERMSYNLNIETGAAQDMYDTLQRTLGQDALDTLVRQGRQMSLEELVNERLPS